MAQRLRGLERIECRLQRGGGGDHDLPAPAGRAHRLEAHRAAPQQAGAGLAGVHARERGETEEDGILHAAREFVRPAGGRLGARRDERVGNGLGRDDRVGHRAAEQVVLVADAERTGCREVDQRLARHEIDRARVAARGVVVSGEVGALERGQPPGDRGTGDPLVAVQVIPLCGAVHDHDRVPPARLRCRVRWDRCRHRLGVQCHTSRAGPDSLAASA